MHHLTMPCLALFALPAFADAQSVMGLINGTNTSFTSRGSATVPNTNPSVAFLRIDKESYAGWGVDPLNPGMRQILGVSGTIQDQLGTTPETYELIVYTEDSANPNYPLMSAPLGTVGPLPTPTSTATGAVAFAVNATFATPILAPATGDTFLGIGMPQPLVGSWPTDGLSLHALYYVMNTTSGTFDLPGPGHPVGQPEEGNGGWYVAPPVWLAGPQYTTNQRQWKLEPILAGATGVAGTITNQASAPLSNNAPGTSSMASGLHPDGVNPPLNAGRIDDIVSRWYMSGTPNGTAVFFLASFNPAGIEIPLSAFLPGSGVVCLDTTAMAQIGLGFTNNGEAYMAWNISPTVRAALGGLTVTHQSVGLDPATSFATVNGCTTQTF